MSTLVSCYLIPTGIGLATVIGGVTLGWCCWVWFGRKLRDSIFVGLCVFYEMLGVEDPSCDPSSVWTATGLLIVGGPTLLVCAGYLLWEGGKLVLLLCGHGPCW